MTKFDLFKNRNAALITKHNKEKVIFPVLEPLGMQLSVLSIDTDQFGTFTRDIPREGTQLATARLKTKKALEVINGESLVIVSEGSFGPHPQIFFAPANMELVLFTDARNNIEIQGWEISTDTNYNHIETASVAEALKFAEKCGFPAHGMVVRPNTGGDNSSVLFKGITSEKMLKDAVTRCISASQDGKALIEPDMRAMYNPTRMKVIEKAAINLLNKLQSLCPQCAWPGFEITEWIKGLPCENCFMPTKSVSNHIYTCKKCSYKKEIEYPDGQKYCEPRFCDFCNP